MMHVTIYSKPGCHLCEDVEAMVRQVQARRRDFELEIRNILDDPAEMEAYQHAIPVITLNGREIGRYRMSEAAFEAELATGSRMWFADVTVVVMAKYPEAGKVKTRLQPALSAEQAAAVHRVFLQHLVRRLRVMSPKRLMVCFDPPGAADRMRQLLGEVDLLPQSGGDLGARLAAAKQALPHEHVLFLGIDAPDVPASVLHAAASALAADVVLGPASDGGYWCLGLRDRVDAKRLLRDIPWSTGREYQQTLQAAQSLGHTTATAPAWDDVDHPADLARLIRRLEQSGDCDDKVLLQAIGAICSKQTRDA